LTKRLRLKIKYTNFGENSTSINKRSQNKFQKNKTFLTPIKLNIVNYERNEAVGNEIKKGTNEGKRGVA